MTPDQISALQHRVKVAQQRLQDATYAYAFAVGHLEYCVSELADHDTH